MNEQTAEQRLEEWWAWKLQQPVLRLTEKGEAREIWLAADAARQKWDVAIANRHADPENENTQWRMCAEMIAKEIEETK